MRILNLPLGHTAMMRAQIAKWATNAMRNCSSMKVVWAVENKAISEKSLKAVEEVAALEVHITTALIGFAIKSTVCEGNPKLG